MDEKLKELREAYNASVEELNLRIDEFEALPEDADDDTVTAARTAMDEAEAEATLRDQKIKDYEATQRAREKHVKVDIPADDPDEPKLELHVNEPDMYRRDNGTFIHDLFLAQIKGDPAAHDRIARHQNHEMEKRSVATSSLGGIIPPQYLVELYAKASRNGRIFADQCNRDMELPETGMTVIIPRLTAGLAAGIQSSEGSAVSTQDPTETDLDVPVRTVAGYSPVSRQTLERAAYAEAILFEDLVARYFSALDVQLLTGSGSSGQHLGLFNTSGISSSTSGTATIADVWSKMADVIQQINTAMGGLGYFADKIIMHPRRHGWFEAALDTTGRPLFGIYGASNYAPIAEGEASGYGPVGRIHGLPVFTDANIPTTQGSGTNQDAIVVMASRVVHLWERDDDPITLAFEQQAGTSLLVELVCYGYSAFTAGRYPAASGAVTGAGLVSPSF